MNWNKTNVLKKDVEELQQKYKTDAITASILLRRGITKGRDIFYYLEDDLRYQHNPFLFNSMEDAVDRILDAAEKDENGNSEKVLIFGRGWSYGYDNSIRMPKIHRCGRSVPGTAG